jgi:hypothetical protein
MDIANNGPVLDAGRFTMRITNIGVIGNAFFNKGLSFDPSFEFPRGSGHECLEHAELWVGATRVDGSIGVSGGPVFEFRPTLDSTDVVSVRYAGDRGTRATFDDDGDGKVDEEFLDGRDNDGDGEVDEDLRFPAQETAACSFTDDTKEAVEFGYQNGEPHVPLKLTVKQEAHAWALPGFDRMAAVHYTITNHGQERLRDVWLGMYANLDSRERSGGSGHLDDAVTMMSDTTVIHDGRRTFVFGSAAFTKDCFTTLGGTWPAVHDARVGSTAPWTALVGVSHTTDPLGYLVNFAYPGAQRAAAAARAPRRDTAFTTSVFSLGLPPRQGGPPNLDADRYAALRGTYPTAPLDAARDYSVLLSCGPFPTLDPGQSVEFAVAFIAADSPDSLRAPRSRRDWCRGTRLGTCSRMTMCRRAPPSSSTVNRTSYGHEGMLAGAREHRVHLRPALYRQVLPGPRVHPAAGAAAARGDRRVRRSPPGSPVSGWTDCDVCTGWGGAETSGALVSRLARAAAAAVPCGPGRPGRDRGVDNPGTAGGRPGMPGAPYVDVLGLSRLPARPVDATDAAPVTHWQHRELRRRHRRSARAIREVLDSSVPYDSVAYEQKHYPVGRYKFRDPRILDGFDYHYVVTAVVQRQVTGAGQGPTEFMESPFRAVFDGIVRPRLEAGGSYRDGKVWVVPNPFRQDAPWDRPRCRATRSHGTWTSWTATGAVEDPHLHAGG